LIKNQNNLLVLQTTDSCSLVTVLFLNLSDWSSNSWSLNFSTATLKKNSTHLAVRFFLWFNSSKQENAFSGKKFEVPVSLHKPSTTDYYKLVVLSHYLKPKLFHYSAQSNTICQLNHVPLALQLSTHRVSSIVSNDVTRLFLII